ncbi:MAG: TonB-dependent receptor [Candidatus Aminicenantes bacterium]|nr:TonB-dependent receptor [Candidatus Aminicenantes bacterium]
METKAPLAGVAVSVAGTEHRSESDAAGAYALPGVPLGYYALSFEMDGYYADARTDIIVRSGRTTFLNVELLKVRMVSEEVRVVADYFPEAPAAPLSRTEFNSEELRRDAGSAGDISRALYVVPGVVRADDEANDLIVRGGSPAENGFYIDNIFMPNINHFPQQGASGGNVSMLNMDFVENIEAFTGGFGASYGNKLSSVFDIAYREGNRERVSGQLNLSAIGYGAQVEGPLPGKRGAWMLSANRSYLDLISKLMDSENPADYYDLNGKATYDLGGRDKLTLLAIGGSSRTDYDNDTRELFSYATAGFNWRHLWGDEGYSDTSVSWSFLDGTENYYMESEGIVHEQYDYSNKWLTLRNVNHLRLAAGHRLEFGAEAQNLRFRNWDDFDNAETRLSGTSAGAFLTYLVQLFPNFSLSAGARVDYVPLSERFHLSPRLSFSWVLTKRLTMNGAYGVFYQQMPLFLIKQDPGNAAQPDPRARHLIVGFKYLLAKDVQLTFEAYDKQYSDHPMSVTYPYGFVIDDVNGDNDRFWEFDVLVGEGRAYARGVELTLQKKISNKVYGLFNLTYYRARYRDLQGFWHNRLFDNRFIVCLSGGYKPSRTWEVNVRWTLAGNKAFTPVDEEMSIQYGFPYIRIEDIGAGHLANYQNFSFRVDKRVSFRGSNLIVFLGALNLFDHKNELFRFWDHIGNQYLSEYMWGAIPYIGFEFEF